MRRRVERPLSSVPGLVLAGFVVTLALQIWVHHTSAREYRAGYKPLSNPFGQETYRGLSMGSKQLLSYLLAMRLQLHDNQAGRHIRYNFINYQILVSWLDRIFQLNPDSEYPMFLASRVYSQTSDKQQLRQVLEYVDKTYTANPQLLWRYQAEASVIAKHRLGDLEFALAMAEKLSRQPETVVMPRWARDMHFLLLAELNEFEATLVIIQALLQSDATKDPDEKRFLQEKLLSFQQKLSEFEHNNQ